jgi:hypothetical protein
MDFEERYDVLVAGAGVAGIAAALECARSGLKTGLVEKTILTGGLATSGLVNYYLPLCDGRGHQVTFGIAEELFHLSILYGPGNIPPGWRGEAPKPEHERYRTPFSPASFVLALDEVLENAGVNLLLDTLACQPVKQGDVMTGVEVETKAGRGLLHAPVVIDATGDADLAYRAGVPCHEGHNYLSLWALHISLEAAQKAVDHPGGNHLLQGVRFGGNAFGKGHPEGMPFYKGTHHHDVSKFVLEGRRLMREYYQEMQTSGERTNRFNQFPLTLPAQAQYRTTRYAEGQTTLVDGQHATYFEDSIGLAADWRKPGYVWEIPLGTLLPLRVRGLLTAGRCISSGGDAWEVTRVIPAAALTGQAAGIIARLAAKSKRLPDEIAPAEVQQELHKLQIPYHLKEVGLPYQ